MAEVEDLGGDISSLKDEDSAVINKTKTTSTNPPYSGDQPASGLTPAEKRLRALKKKLQQIENLKEKMEHGETLEKTQVRALLRTIKMSIFLSAKNGYFPKGLTHGFGQNIRNFF